MTDENKDLGLDLGYEEEEQQAADRRARWWHDREREGADLREIMQTRAGRRFLRRLISKCCVFDDFEDSNASIYRKAGMRKIGLDLNLDMQAADQRIWLKLQTEFLEDELRKRDRETQPAA